MERSESGGSSPESFQAADMVTVLPEAVIVAPPAGDVNWTSAKTKVGIKERTARGLANIASSPDQKGWNTEGRGMGDKRDRSDRRGMEDLNALLGQ